MTYVVLVILIALWAVVLVPPYLKDRRESNRSFRTSQSGSLPAITSAQRFQPLRNAGPAVGSTAVAGPAVRAYGNPVLANGPQAVAHAGPATHAGFSNAQSNLDSLTHNGSLGHSGSNVVQLHPADDGIQILDGPAVSEAALQQVWGPGGGRAGMPTSTASARERRRNVLLTLTGTAFVTLLLALTLRGGWIALNVGIDAVLVGYVILLVRMRQISSERQHKVEPIRPPVTVQGPTTIQAAPDYLLRSGT